MVFLVKYEMVVTLPMRKEIDIYFFLPHKRYQNVKLIDDVSTNYRTTQAI